MKVDTKIPFNIPLVLGLEQIYLQEVLAGSRFCGDGDFTRECNKKIEEITSCDKTLLTTSCTHAMEMAAILLDIGPGDEIIMPSFTFVSSANAFVLRGAKIVFVDVRPDNMNINEELIEPAITDRTKVIMPVHYGGVGCRMDRIMETARQYGLYVVEDAAQCIGATYKGRHLGTFGDFGTISFHETKNIHCGEGGTLLINNGDFIEQAEIIREKGTNRSRFLRGEVDKYSWVSVGSSYLPSELNAAFLLAQLEKLEEVTSRRLKIWEKYQSGLQPLEDAGLIEKAIVPRDCGHNGHLFYIKCESENERSRLIQHLKKQGIQSVFHYVPLHTAKAGKEYGRFHGEDVFTTRDSERLLRLPLQFHLSDSEIDSVVQSVRSFYH